MVRRKDTGLPLTHSAGPLSQREKAAAKDLGAQSQKDTRGTWAGHPMTRPRGGAGAVRGDTPSRGRPGAGQVLPRRRPRSQPLPPGARLNMQPPTLALLTRGPAGGRGHRPEPKGRGKVAIHRTPGPDGERRVVGGRETARETLAGACLLALGADFGGRADPGHAGPGS